MIIVVSFQFQAVEKKKPEKIRASTGSEPVTSAIPVRCSTNRATKPHIGSEKQSINTASTFLIYSGLDDWY